MLFTVHIINIEWILKSGDEICRTSPILKANGQGLWVFTFVCFRNIVLLTDNGCTFLIISNNIALHAHR